MKKMKKLKVDQLPYTKKGGNSFVKFRGYELKLFYKDKTEDFKDFLEIETDIQSGNLGNYLRCVHISDVNKIVKNFYEVEIITEPVICSENNEIYSEIKEFFPSMKKKVKLFQKKEKIENFEMISLGFIKVKNPAQLQDLWVKEEDLSLQEKISKNLETLFFFDEIRLKQYFSKELHSQRVSLILGVNDCFLIVGKEIDILPLYSLERSNFIIVSLNKLIKSFNKESFDLNQIKAKIKIDFLS